MELIAEESQQLEDSRIWDILLEDSWHFMNGGIEGNVVGIDAYHREHPIFK